MTVLPQDQAPPRRGLLDDWLARLNLETGLYILIGLVAFGVRIIQLGDAPLSALEAREALSAWRLVSMSSFAPTEPVSAAWSTLTALTFFLLGAGEFWARFWPALAGLALVFAPLLFRRELGRGAVMTASALLAFSPVMLAASRTADGTTLAALGLVLLLAGLRQSAGEPFGSGWLLAGFGLGLGLASGPRFVSGVMAGLLAVSVAVLVKPSLARQLRSGWDQVRPQLGRLLVAASATFVAFATGGINPAGLSAAGAAVPHWLAGWMAGSAARPIWLIPQTLFIYEPLLFAMALCGLYVALLSGYRNAIAARDSEDDAVRSDASSDLPLLAVGEAIAGGGAVRRPAIAVDSPWRQATIVIVAAVVGTLLYSLIYVGREASDAIWVVLPLSLLAGKVFAEIIGGDWFEGEWETVAAQAGVLFVMFVFVYFHLAGYARGALLAPDRPLELRLYLAGAVLGLSIFVTIMFGLGWSTLSALRGAALALGLALTIGALGAGFGLSLWRAGDPNELWITQPTTRHVSLMLKTIRDISQRAAGKETELEITVVSASDDVDQNGLLGWELRDFPRAKFVNSVGLAADSPIIIADAAVSDPLFDSQYLGETFPVQSRQLLTEPTLQGLVNWWLYRVWPTEFSRTVTLWVRADVHNLIQSRSP